MKVNVKDREKLEKCLKIVQHRASARTIDLSYISHAVEKAEEQLSKMLYKKDWVDIVVHCDPHSQKFPSSYKGRPESTQFEIRKYPSGWFVVSLSRRYCRERAYHYEFTNIAHKSEQLVEFAKRPF